MDILAAPDWNLIALILVVVVSGLAIFITYMTFKMSLDRNAYSDLDTMYEVILKLWFEHPEFRDVTKTSTYQKYFTKNKLIQYDTYAHMVWNVCETAYDYTRKNNNNWKTWKPVILEEHRLHGSWLMDELNQKRFKSEFIKFTSSIEK